MRTLRAIALGVVWVAGTGCGAPRAYHLRLNAANSSESMLCRVTADAGVAEEEDCEIVSGQRLDAESQLSISVERATAGGSYELEVNETRVGAGTDAGTVLSTFLDGLLGLAGGVGSQLMTRAPSEVLGGLIQRDQLQAVIDRAPAAVRDALREPLAGLPSAANALAPDSTSVDALRSDQVTDGHLITRDVAFDDDDVTPFVRASVLTPSDLDALEEARLGLADVAEFAVRYCRNESWGPVPGFDAPLAELVDRELDAGRVLAALGLDASVALAAFEGRPVAIEERIRERLTAAHSVTQAGGNLSGDEAVIRQLVVEAALARDLAHCRANIELLLVEGATELDDAHRNDLTSVREEVRDLETRTLDAREAYNQLVLPFLTERAVEYLERIADSAGRIDFGSRVLHAGTISVSLHRGSEEPIHVELAVGSAPDVAVSVGPVLTLCDDCIYRVSDEPAAADAAATPPLPAGRVIRQRRDDWSMAVAISLHVSVLELGDHHLGFMVGYPIGSGTGTPAAALVGVSYRFAPIGLQVGAGVQLFESVHLSQSRLTRTDDLGTDEDESSVDLRRPGNELLTARDVTQSDLGWAAFVMVAASYDILSSL